MTPVTYYRADTTISVPKLNIVGGKVPTWLKFTQNFKPVAQAQSVEDLAVIHGKSYLMKFGVPRNIAFELA